MLKEVGASGQISLGKKYARQLFQAQTQADGSILMLPVKAVPMAPTVQEEPTRYAAGETSNAQLAEQHGSQIAQYNAWATERVPYSQRVRHWRKEGI